MLPSTILCGVSESSGGGVPTLDRDHSRPSLRRQCLHLFYPSRLTCSNCVLGLHFSSPPPDLYPIAPAYFSNRHLSPLYLHPLLPPPISTRRKALVHLGPLGYSKGSTYLSNCGYGIVKNVFGFSSIFKIYI